MSPDCRRGPRHGSWLVGRIRNGLRGRLAGFVVYKVALSVLLFAEIDVRLTEIQPLSGTRRALLMYRNRMGK